MYNPISMSRSAIVEVVLVGLLLAISACRTKPTQEDCKKMAAKKVAIYFADAPARIKQNAQKHELNASLEECLASWSKKEAICVLTAETRDEFVACRQ